MSDRPRRKLIEVALPLEAINQAAAYEKEPFTRRHPRAMHIWWARRPLVACRAILFASLVDDPSSDPDHFPTEQAQDAERLRLFGVLERLVQWENSTNEEVLSEARSEILRSTHGSPPPVLDPFSGGGSIPLEAQRLGLTAYASDLNPVAVLITKALIEIPPKFAGRPPVHPDARQEVGHTGTWDRAAGLAEDVRRYATWMRNEAERRVGEFYLPVSLPERAGGHSAPATAWLWARTVTCPNPGCGATIPLVQSFSLSTKAGKETWLQPLVEQASLAVRFEVRSGRGGPPDATKVGRGSAFRCLVCHQVTPVGYVRSQGQDQRIGSQLMAVVAQGRSGRVYLDPTDEQERAARLAVPEWRPEQELSANIRHSTPPTYGMRHFGDLFTPRQLVALTTLCDLIPVVRSRVASDALLAGMSASMDPLSEGGEGHVAYADAVSVYLALAISRWADLSNSLVSWNSTNENARALFSRQAFPMGWDYCEVNPFSSAIGVSLAFDNVATSLDALPASGIASVRQADAAGLPEPQERVLVSTDPPYYDNVPFADLSDFFYVWLRKALSDTYPSLGETLVTPKTEEIVADLVRHGGKRAARDHFEAGLTAAFQRIASVCSPEYPVTIFYAFKQTESDAGTDGGSTGDTSTGWETMLESLMAAGFVIGGTWPVRTERATRSRALDANALASSIVLVCRPRSGAAGITDRRGFVSSLKQELPEALRTLQHGNIAPVDLAQASIGPGMAVFSRHAKVLEPDGSLMRVRTALGLINQVLDEILAEQEGEFDADTRWAIAWYEQVGLGEAAYGIAETLSKAKDTSIAGLVEAGIVAAGKGKVRLLSRAEYSADWDPAKDDRIPVWEATQRLIHALLDDGEAAAASLLVRLGGVGDTARDLAYRMYHVAERKGWSDEARAYNALVVAWMDFASGGELAQPAEPTQASLGLE